MMYTEARNNQSKFGFLVQIFAGFLKNFTINHNCIIVIGNSRIHCDTDPNTAVAHRTRREYCILLGNAST